MDAEPLALLWEATLAGSAAVLLVLILRRPVRAWLGASAAYALWLCVPVALLAVMLPRGIEVPLEIPLASQASPVVLVGMAVEAEATWHLREWLFPLWLAGALGSLAVLGWQQRRFSRGLGALSRRDDGLYQSSVATAGLPAVTGLLRPKILLPADFERRYTAQEQSLVLAHERLHVRRGDLVANGVAALLVCVFWFNPLLHLALRRFRLDQELACDERVIARHPQARRSYGEAMLKTQFDPAPLPLGCHWQARHPLKERIDMLKRPTPSPLHWMLAMLFAIGLSAGTGYAAWAAQPATPASPANAAAAQEGWFLLARKNSYGGMEGEGVLMQWVKAGEPAVSVSGSGANQWKNTAVLEAGVEPGTVKIRMRIEQGDPWKTVSEPMLITSDGKAASIGQRDTDGEILYQSAMVSLPFEGSREATEARMHELLTGSEAAPGVFSEATVARTRELVAKLEEQRVGAAEQPATVRSRTPAPAYPKEALRHGQSGQVVAVVDIDAQGVPVEVLIEKSEPTGVFDATTIATIKQWRFTPAMKDGRAVPGRVRVPVAFDSGMTEVASPVNTKDAENYRWFRIDQDKVSEVICDVMNMPQGNPDQAYCGILKETAGR